MKIPQNRTKIVATIGPASGDPKTLEKLIDAGLDVARFNFSHGDYVTFKKWMDTVRSISKKKGQPVAILQDLQGPRIRVGGDVPKSGLELKFGEIINVGYGKYKKGFLPIDYKDLIKDIKKGTRILLVDGLIELEVIQKEKKLAKAKVVSGGMVFPRKGVNIPNARLNIPAVTKKDNEDLKWGIDYDVDYIGLSFVQSAKDIQYLRSLIAKRNKNSKVKIIAKIEKPKAFTSIKSILKEVDGVMVARGDLGIELPPEKVPVAQKEIILAALEVGKPVIVATQMMESMVGSPRPTRAEVSDVANAILDGADAVMLSEETAMGKYPVNAVSMMSKIATEIEDGLFKRQTLGFENISREELKNLKSGHPHVTSADAMGLSVRDIAKSIGAKYIAVATLSGYSARMVSRNRPGTKVVAFTPDSKLVNQMALLWGVRSYSIAIYKNAEELVEEINKSLKSLKLARRGDKMVIVSSHPIGKSGETNLVKIEDIK